MGRGQMIQGVRSVSRTLDFILTKMTRHCKFLSKGTTQLDLSSEDHFGFCVGNQLEEEKWEKDYHCVSPG